MKLNNKITIKIEASYFLDYGAKVGEVNGAKWN